MIARSELADNVRIARARLHPAFAAELAREYATPSTRRRGYVAGSTVRYRCGGCGLFLSGQYATCRSCGHANARGESVR